MYTFSGAPLSDLHSAILRTAAYADVFDYPLTAAEIHRYLTGLPAGKDAVEQALRRDALLPECDGYYTLPNREGLVEVRRRREQIARQLWPLAVGYGQMIARLPFVRMIAVTGSLSMNNAESNLDIDYFIVTAPGRLWTVRAMALAVTRLAAMRGVRLCPNYLVTENALVFPDQSIYAAHELAQMAPLSGLDVYDRINRLNPWKDRYLPNAQGVPPLVGLLADHPDQPALKPFIETALRTPPGNWFEGWERRRKIRKLTGEQSDSPESCFAADYCKGHNLRHGQRTEHLLRERLERLQLETTV